jgi:hypothetical protein
MLNKEGGVMKYLIGVAVWFVLGFGIQFIRAWITEIRIWWAKKHASDEHQWMYE